MQALILCGGKGERLRPLTSNIPKPMIKINGKPILEYIIDHILLFGIKDFILTTGYQSQVIEDYIRERYPNINIIFSNSGDVDIIKRIIDASLHINNDFLVFYGDTISDVNIFNLIQHHNNNTEPATMTTWPLKNQSGVVEIDSKNIISSYKEKPVNWINIGYFYFRQEMIPYIKKFDKYELFLIDLINKGKFNAHKHPGYHITVNTIYELEDAEKNIDQIQNTIIGN